MGARAPTAAMWELARDGDGTVAAVGATDRVIDRDRVIDWDRAIDRAIDRGRAREAGRQFGGAAKGAVEQASGPKRETAPTHLPPLV